MIERRISELLANLLNRYSSRAEAGKKIVLIETFEEAGFETNEEGFILHLAGNKTLKITVSSIQIKDLVAGNIACDIYISGTNEFF